MKTYTCQCSRCDGSGRYDRGDCFDCNGSGFVNRKTQPRGLTPFVLEVIYSNGSKNIPTVWASSRSKAVAIVARMIRVKGWQGEVK